MTTIETNMHFIIFKDAIPYEIHKFNQLDTHEKQYVVWEPPTRDKQYLYEGENIYGIIFPVTDEKTIDNKLWLLDLVFGVDESNYNKTIWKLTQLFKSGDFSLVTDYGVRSGVSISLSGIGPKKDSVMCSAEHLDTYKCFDRVLSAITKVETNGYLEAIKQTLATNVLGDFYTVRIPLWYTRSKVTYGKSDKDLVSIERKKYMD